MYVMGWTIKRFASGYKIVFLSKLDSLSSSHSSSSSSSSSTILLWPSEGGRRRLVSEVNDANDVDYYFI